APNAETNLRTFVAEAWPALERLGLAPGATQANLSFTADLAEALRDTDFVQENGPERIAFKQELYGQLDALLAPHVIIASSSSGPPRANEAGARGGGRPTGGGALPAFRSPRRP